MSDVLDALIEEISQQDNRYKEDAYTFVLEALSYTKKKFTRDHHVSGLELLEGVKQLLMRRFGPMTLTVLDYWGIKETQDIGNIVFNLIQKKVLSKTEEDDIAHFKDVYDFTEVFDRGYRKKLYKKVSRMR